MACTKLEVMRPVATRMAGRPSSLRTTVQDGLGVGCRVSR